MGRSTMSDSIKSASHSALRQRDQRDIVEIHQEQVRELLDAVRDSGINFIVSKEAIRWQGVMTLIG